MFWPFINGGPNQDPNRQLTDLLNMIKELEQVAKAHGAGQAHMVHIQMVPAQSPYDDQAQETDQPIEQPEPPKKPQLSAKNLLMLDIIQNKDLKKYKKLKADFSEHEQKYIESKLNEA